MAITAFKDEHRFLSNFYPSEVVFLGEKYATVEHAYQAAKTLDKRAREKIRAAHTPGQAKRLGQRVELRADWERVKIEIMRTLLVRKFENSELAAKLLATGSHELVEGNHWGDTFWGQCPVGTGFNHLGLLLMDVRRDLSRPRG